jgi:hypothetical protein
MALATRAIDFYDGVVWTLDALYAPIQRLSLILVLESCQKASMGLVFGFISALVVYSDCANDHYMRRN